MNGNLLSLERNGFGSAVDMDRYYTLGGKRSNRLSYVVDDAIDHPGYDDIKSGQVAGNYTYNKIGELTEDASEDMKLEWRYGDHKLSKITRTDAASPNITFLYTPFGQRAMKLVEGRSGGSLTGEQNFTYYSYDANGQVMAVYEIAFPTDSYKLNERHLYGAERLGVNSEEVTIYQGGNFTSYTHKEEDVVHTEESGHKRYELTNHLGNVLAVINDRKIYNSTDQNYEPVMMSWSDYYAFGMTMPGRNGGVGYRYQFNGMEHDSEVSGNGNSYTTEFRQYDPRLGRWKSLDPLMAKFPHSSPYVAFANNPVYFTDPYGLEPVNDGGDGGDGGGDTFPENPNEGDDFTRTDAKGTEWHYKYENGVWVGQGGEINSDRDIVVTPGNKATYDQARSSVKSGNLDRFEFNRQYKMYDWCRYDPNCNNFRGTAMHRRLQEQFDLVVYEEAIKIYKAFAIVAVSFAGGGALAPAALEIGGALLSTLPELEAIITYYYITAEAAYFNTVYTLSKYVAGRVLIYTTSIMIGTSTPTIRNGGAPTTQTLYSRGSVLRAPVGGVDLPGGGFAKGGRWYSGPRFLFQRNSVNIPDAGVLNPWEPWPRNTMIDVAGRRPWLAPLSNPWIRGGAVGLGSYGAYKHMELQYKLRNE